MRYLILNLKAIKFLISNPKYIGLCLLPVFIAFIVTIVLIYFAIMGFQYLTSINPDSTQVYSFLIPVIKFLHYFNDGFLKWLATIIIILISLWAGFSLITGLLLDPFLEIISNSVEKEIRGQQFDVPWYRGLLGSILFSSGMTIAKAISLFMGFILSFIFPPLAIINFLMIAWYAAAESIDCSMSRHQFSVNQKIKFLFSQKTKLFWLGSFSALLMAIPIINIIQPILATISGTLYFITQTPELGVKEEYKKFLNLDKVNYYKT